MTKTTSNIKAEQHWGLVPEGDAARILGAGDPHEIVAGAQPESTDIGD